MTETALQHWILGRYEREGLHSSDPPTVAVNEHSGDAHFTNTAALDRPIRSGDWLLLDAWAKAKRPGAVYADYTQVAFLGAAPPDSHRAAFQAAREARDAAIAYVRDALRGGRAPRGCDVDDAAREVIRGRGWGDRFFHRTGHSIGEDIHGNGANMDNFETRDHRRIIPGTCFSVEPGIYLPEFGVRSEVDVYVEEHDARVTGEVQQAIVPILAASD